MPTPLLPDVLLLMQLLHRFQRVERKVYVPEEQRQENDVEHSYILAVLAVYIRDLYKPGLDRERVVFYALIHDLVEVYAGDTFFYDTSSEHAHTKPERERIACERLCSEFSHWQALCVALRGYEERVDTEARFVYALDKIAPILTIFVDGGRTWREENITLERLVALKRPKIEHDEIALELFDELVVVLKEQRERLF